MPRPKPVAIGLILLMAPVAPAQRLPLPPDEQNAVNHAIDRGVDYLKRAQQKNGTWADPRNNWQQAKFHQHIYAVGFTALPALTLLECGVPASDPLVQQSARFVRSQAAKLDRTYELSLAILFLDRLGDAKDKKLIQTFALRLIAGQSPTGGWSYKCPILTDKMQTELLLALRHLDPPAEDMPALARGGGKKPDEQPPIARAGGAPMLEGQIARPGNPPLSESIRRRSPGESFSSQEAITDSGSRGRDDLDLATRGKKNPEKSESKPDAIVGSKQPQNKSDVKPGKDKSADAKATPNKPAKPYVIPQRIKRLPVAEDPNQHILRNPVSDVVASSGETRTDNSNTQFAILALWTAQRYEVPMKRSLNLIVRRYQTSQNANGSWNYRYYFGGAVQHEGFSSPGAMTCVGLIGLAVGHGLGEPHPAGQPVQDPRIINGLIALSDHIGQPVEQAGRQPMQNLYYLWSLERVAVLYNLPVIGDKDWYRWGAQVLVGNQDPAGNWANGLYHGSSPPLDTCLALLFLKRANLVKDLTDKLPFKAGELNHSIMEKLTPQKPAELTEKPKKPKKPLPPIEPTKATEPEAPVAVAQMPPTLDEPPPEVESSGGKTKWIIVSLMLFIIFAGGSLFFLFSVRRRDVDEDEVKDDKPKKRTNKRKPRSTA